MVECHIKNGMIIKMMPKNPIVNWAMECTNISHLKKKSINEISGGESQRVWIATVLAQNPEILFLDEPTTYLDISLS